MGKNKTFSSEISQRYALALYELSKENNLTDEFASNIISFKKVFDTNEELKKFVINPTYSLENQKIVFDKILTSMSLNKMVKNFFSLLILKKRMFFLNTIIDEFLKIISHNKGEISGSLITAKKIDEKVTNDIEKEISNNIKRPIKLKSKVDETLIGGLIIQIGSLMIDTSIKNKLQKYKKLMNEA